MIVWGKGRCGLHATLIRQPLPLSFLLALALMGCKEARRPPQTGGERCGNSLCGGNKTTPSAEPRARLVGGRQSI